MGGKRHKKGSAPKPTNHDAKQWNPIFFTKRRLKDSPFLDTQSALKANGGDAIQLFVGTAEYPSKWWDAEAVERFCRSTQHKVNCEPITPARARIDDRERSTGCQRQYPKWLTPDQLCDALRYRMSGSPGLPDADRRLIYISRLTPDYVDALVETASCNQINVLRDTVGKHIASETSFRVHNSLDGSIIFRLELHLPYLTLRESNEDFEYPQGDEGMNSGRKWTSIPFLDIESSQNEATCRHFVEEAHISVVVSGVDHFRWGGYAFANTSFDDDCDDDVEDFKEDLFASVDAKGSVLEADKPIWDPRVYWLRVADFRLGIMVEESIRLVMKIDTSVKKWLARNSFTLNAGPRSWPREHMRLTFDRLSHTIELISKLCNYFSATIQAGEMFNGPGGDREYFSDMTHHHARISLNNIKESFEKLKNLERKLTALDRLCQKSAEILGLRISLENNQLSSEGNEMNLQSSKIAFASHEAASRMYNTTCTSLEIVLWTTPIGIALQLFGSEREIFPFERSPRTFFVFITLAVLALRVLVFFISRLDQIKKAIIWQISIRCFHQDIARSAGEMNRLSEPGQRV